MPSGFFYGEIRMDMFGKFKSIFGYENNEDEKNKIDSYGVDHSNFSLRDEIEYQMARVNREDQFKQSYNKQGIIENYPQFGKSFWGNNSENNYGFGSSNISENIEQMKEKGFPTLEETLQYQNQMNGQNSMTTPTPWGQSNTVQSNGKPSYWDTASDGKNVYSKIREQENFTSSSWQNPISYLYSGAAGLGSLIGNYRQISSDKALTDKYKHALMNCSSAQYGTGGVHSAQAASWFGEQADLLRGKNSLDSSNADNYANKIGRGLGSKYPDEDCDDLVRRYIRKYWK